MAYLIIDHIFLLSFSLVEVSSVMTGILIVVTYPMEYMEEGLYKCSQFHGASLLVYQFFLCRVIILG